VNTIRFYDRRCKSVLPVSEKGLRDSLYRSIIGLLNTYPYLSFESKCFVWKLVKHYLVEEHDRSSNNLEVPDKLLESSDIDIEYRGGD
jgi:hypothetical protein